MGDDVYLDYTGAGVYRHSQIARVMADLDTHLYGNAQCTPSMFVCLFEALLFVRLEEIERHPKTFAHHAHNARVVIEVLSKQVLGLDLSGIRPERVATGDRVAVLRLIEVFWELSYVLAECGDATEEELYDISQQQQQQQQQEEALDAAPVTPTRPSRSPTPRTTPAAGAASPSKRTAEPAAPCAEDPLDGQAADEPAGDQGSSYSTPMKPRRQRRNEGGQEQPEDGTAASPSPFKRRPSASLSPANRELLESIRSDWAQRYLTPPRDQQPSPGTRLPLEDRVPPHVPRALWSRFVKQLEQPPYFASPKEVAHRERLAQQQCREASRREAEFFRGLAREMDAAGRKHEYTEGRNRACRLATLRHDTRKMMFDERKAREEAEREEASREMGARHAEELHYTHMLERQLKARREALLEEKRLHTLRLRSEKEARKTLLEAATAFYTTEYAELRERAEEEARDAEIRNKAQAQAARGLERDLKRTMNAQVSRLRDQLHSLEELSLHNAYHADCRSTL
eukprot:m51a1_g3213 hypothetical protein (514) ;mRNA; r:34464-36600